MISKKMSTKINKLYTYTGLMTIIFSFAVFVKILNKLLAKRLMLIPIEPIACLLFKFWLFHLGLLNDSDGVFFFYNLTAFYQKAFLIDSAPPFLQSTKLPKNLSRRLYCQEWFLFLTFFFLHAFHSVTLRDFSFLLIFSQTNYKFFLRRNIYQNGACSAGI